MKDVLALKRTVVVSTFRTVYSARLQQNFFILLKTSRVYCSKRRDNNGSFQSQHILHGCTRKFTSNSYFLLSTPCKASNITNLTNGYHLRDGIKLKTRIVQHEVKIVLSVITQLEIHLSMPAICARVKLLICKKENTYS